MTAPPGAGAGLASRLRPADLLPLATMGLRGRRVRTALSTLGIAIGIAAIVAVLGITRSSQSELLARIDRLGTNLLTVTAGQSLGDEVPLPATAGLGVARVEGVEHVAVTAVLNNVQVYRSDRIPLTHTGGLDVRATGTGLLATLDGRVAAGVFLSAATARYPVTVLGQQAAVQLGVARPGPGTRVRIGGHWFVVAGVLAPLELSPELDRAALIGLPAARALFGYDDHPTRLYVRADTARVAQTVDLLARAVNPADPPGVQVSRPSDALASRLLVADSGTSLFLGLGAVALFVGGVGIANVMVISVLERRAEIGLRRALGARRPHIAGQFLVESLVLATLGGLTGTALGALITYVTALERGWPPVVPPGAPALGLGAALAVGALAGLYPAVRAAGLPPTDALRAV
ncbi:ABC transporter permease [Microbispora sp. RL4-1S]|uniref:ABC transporter permease n=1 Tax=Microbispora oryzae TaxID=2806554 RepID=A0A941ARQ9_9ACTN|nr:ABC transporter permease [Microbispora oryzae]MBP2706514.1 ABC transporter permease [Microbispora oryzae]